MKGNKVTKLKGFNDWFGEKSEKFLYVFDLFKDIAVEFGYEYLVLPTLEKIELFKRSSGDGSDIVNKEMYEFEDKAGRKVALRPEGTASVVRLFIENGFDKTAPDKKFFYFANMFRYEKPQAGRLREFYQLGLENFGTNLPEKDWEIIYIFSKLLEELEVDANLYLNNIGCETDRKKYIAELKDYLEVRKNLLCTDCIERITKGNYLRVLDCKVCKNVLVDAPVIKLCDNCKSKYDLLKEMLVKSDIKFVEDKKLVRGLDYYTSTVFEFQVAEEKQQNAVVAGGRYDNLVAQLGGNPTAAVGAAAGLERLLLYSNVNMIVKKDKLMFIYHPSIRVIAPKIFLKLKEYFKNIFWYPANFKKQFNYANKLKVKKVIIVGEEELKNNRVVIKNLVTGEQVTERFEF